MVAILFPTWEQLPDIELYLDQVLSYVNNITSQAFEIDGNLLTASMVNNYVKHGHIPKPIKKKYSKQQVARLVSITILKNVFTIQDISTTIQYLGQTRDSQTLYNSFVACMKDETEQLEIPPVISFACQTVKLYYQTRQTILTFSGGEHDDANT